jgi:hypothetical protein
VRIGTTSKGMIFVATISDKRVLRSMNRLIHRSARKGDSANFPCTGFSEVRSPRDFVTVVVTFGRRQPCRVVL